MEITKLAKEKYPYLLKQIKNLPDALYMSGQLPSDDNKFLCVIGSRAHSKYGEEACERLISGLKGYPVVIVSGLAIGIDSLAHKAALSAGLATMSFPGSGLSDKVLYPPSRRSLAKRIVDSGGALLSPFNIDQEGTQWTFPVRNRLMAGASHATLIIEAKHHSGTLITADYAAEFGRDILAIPGSIFSDLSYGPHMLIRRGATPISSSSDILEALGFKIFRADGMQQALPNFAEVSFSEEERTIVDCLRSENLTSTDLIERIGLPSSKFNSIISELELRGLVSQIGGRYRLS
ncbi:DNA-processing protein DprA [Patescibacteria group bacterium]|nr:DNA-processing protein DprA [Patescibacteria group bacterium]MDE1946962.1 DNA-processing protein DprA [Patescibacteria group bacterium]MDE2011235.1 DNA-processing protein DprA [Patescibacteria group bacterium]MDE2233399.1 DNA-processing protein DprA [Patescibacteria group bacterium]